MSAVYNPQADLMAEIERLEMEARDLRRRIDHAAADKDKQVLRQQMDELKQAVMRLQARLVA